MSKYISALILILSVFSASAEDKIYSYIDNLTKSVNAVINDENLSSKGKITKLEQIFFDNVDVDWIGRFALGRTWNNIPKDKQEKYMKVYREYLAAIYIPHFEKYTLNSLKVKGVSQTKDNEYLVQTEISDSSGINVQVNYRVNLQNGKYKIFDIVAEGVSLITTQRSEFNSILSSSNIDVLISKMQISVERKNVS